MRDSKTTAIPMPPGGQIEIVFSFDTTGSMRGYIEKVRSDVVNIITRLLGDVPSLRIAVLAHGDYCDVGTYVTKHVDFTRSADELCDFVKTVGATGGGDWEECYELALQEIRTKLSWQPGTQRALVMIGDAKPHEVAYYREKMSRKPCGKGRGRKSHSSNVFDWKETLLVNVIDWKEEVRRLHQDAGVRVYAVQCGRNITANPFWEYLANNTGGTRLCLDDFNSTIELIMAICYRETGPDVFAAYEREIRDRQGEDLRKDLDIMFGHLRDPATTTTTAPPLKPSMSTSGTMSLLAKADSAGPFGKENGRKRKFPHPGLDSDSDYEVASATGPAKKRQKVADSTTKTIRGGKKGVGKKTVTKALRDFTGSTNSLKVFLKGNTGAHQHRESNTVSFAFSDLEWSRWQLAMAPKSAITPTTKGRWRQRPTGHTGMRNVALFQDARDEPAVFELAIQLSTKSQKKHVVLLRSSNGFESRCWDSYLLRDLKVRRKLDKMLLEGHKVYARRAIPTLPYTAAIGDNNVTVKDVEELRRLMCVVYDYSWTERRLAANVRGSRQVKRSGLVISGN